MELKIETLIEILKKEAEKHPGAVVGVVNTLYRDEEICDIEGVYFSKYHNRIILDIDHDYNI